MNIETFWTRVEKTNSCWFWKGAKTSAGYGHLVLDGTHEYAHRLTYRLENGPITEGLHIDHLCRVRHCVNPAHLEAVSHAENVRRGLAPFGVLRSECKRGHDISDPENVRELTNGTRQCLICHRIRMENRLAKLRKRPWPRTHCPKGHEYTPENTQFSKQGHRRCAECNRANALTHYRRKKGAE